MLRWKADDGAAIVGRLYTTGSTPAGAVPPLLCWIHGGPTDQWLVTFDARMAYFLDRGWAILVPDHRGSTGHGRAYAQAMAGRWGELDVADCAAGVRHVLAAGRADPERVAVMGGSAGGFTTLLLLAHHPELFAAGVALSAVADLVDLGERSHRFERHYNDTLVGPLPGAGRCRRAAHPSPPPSASPRRCCSCTATPTRSSPSSRRRRWPTAAALGREVELHVYDGEGHGWGRPETVVDELTRIERFLAHHVLRTVVP